MATARDIIKAALRQIHVLGVGSSLTDEEAQDALDTLNSMLSVWSVDGNMVYTETIETFNLTGGDGEYTIGSGGDFNTTRPISIDAAYVTQGSTDYSLMAYDKQQYADIPQKDLGGISRIFYYDAGYPLGTIRLFSIPEGVTTITLYTTKPLTQFTDLDTSFAMPEEYKAALIYNLAVWIAPEYERDASPTTQKKANYTKRAVEIQNARNDKHVATVNVPSRSATNAYDRNAILRGDG